MRRYYTYTVDVHFFLSICPKEATKATKMQGGSRNERENYQKLRMERNPNPKPETSDKQWRTEDCEPGNRQIYLTCHYIIT